MRLALLILSLFVCKAFAITGEVSGDGRSSASDMAERRARIIFETMNVLGDLAPEAMRDLVAGDITIMSAVSRSFRPEVLARTSKTVAFVPVSGDATHGTREKLALTAAIRLSQQPRMNLERYLVYFFRSIPLVNLELVAADVYRVKGFINVDVSEIPEPLKSSVERDVARALQGELKISGALFDGRDATLRFFDRKSGWKTRALDYEEIIKKWEAVGCGDSLAGRI